ncbi:hypothetical protein C493_08641 [Natronolimnohabitans innermongolicus JCM 12255]|uniref:Uncharacterized protein n=1 Tax=Natronolimnohabitans innermongolicus JCM 12255 TaxID=1227499 RepID=L9XAB5_9EURY|nr:hypothetical protein C493_08641 [Natronolimnohabitans innermongolicus JCM 12255]
MDHQSRSLVRVIAQKVPAPVFFIDGSEQLWLLFDDLEVHVCFDARDKPAVIGVNTVEQPEIVVAKIE